MIDKHDFNDYYYLDLETSGFNGIAVTIQYAPGDESPKFHHVWHETVGSTLDLIERFMEQGYVAFNTTFDHFHMQKLFCMLSMLHKKFGSGAAPIDHVDWLVKHEADARFVDICLKPSKCIDLMLHAARGPYQALQARKDIRISKVPAMLAPTACQYLNEHHGIEPIYGAKFTVVEHKEKGTASKQWNDIKLSFHGNMQLKTFASILLKEDVARFDSIRPDVMSNEEGYAPWASAWKGRLATRNDARKGLRAGQPYITWDEVIYDHIRYWETNEDAIRYGLKDVEYLQRLHRLPEFRDADPECFDHKLAAHIGSVRWRGFAIDRGAFESLREKYDRCAKSVPDSGTRGKRVMQWLKDNLTQTQFEVIEEKGTSKEVVEKLIEAWDSETLTRLVAARKAQKRVEMIDKLLHAGRLHPDYRVNGTLSNRLAGAGGLNTQGFPRQKEFRNCFTLADEGFDCQCGDFDSHEIAIAEAVYDDESLRADLQSGKKFHALFGESMFQKEYHEIIADKDLYDKAKRGGFGLNYGGNWATLLHRGLVDTEEEAKRTENDFLARYPGILRSRTENAEPFKSMWQDEYGHVHYREPKQYAESMLGFRRWFTHENHIVKFLYDTSTKLPTRLKCFDHVTVIRRSNKGEQRPSGALMSALYLAAFNLQNRNARAAINHAMQSVGGETCKDMQAELADLQPAGVHSWRIATFNVHDEIAAAVRKDIASQPQDVVARIIAKYKPQITFIGMKWEKNLRFWKDEE